MLGLDDDFDVKRDVMPSSDPGPEQLAEFEQSIAEHFQKIAPLKKLRKTKEAMHPISGPFDAHKRHCLFGFQLQIHRKQIEAIEKILLAESK